MNSKLNYEWRMMRLWSDISWVFTISVIPAGFTLANFVLFGTASAQTGLAVTDWFFGSVAGVIISRFISKVYSITYYEWKDPA